MEPNIFETGIDGFKIHLNKSFFDERGALFQLTPNISENPNLPEGIENVVSVMAVAKDKPRGGHYSKSYDSFFNIFGLGCWLFIDLREKSPTRGQDFACLAGLKSEEAIGKAYDDLPRFFASKNNIHHFYVPPGIYRLLWPLSRQPMIIIEARSALYRNDDVKIDPGELEQVARFKSKYGLY